MPDVVLGCDTLSDIMFNRPSSPTKAVAAIERELGALQNRRNVLEERIAEAARLAEEHRAGAVKVALNGADQSELNRLEGLKRASEDRRSTLSAAQAQLDANIVDVEGRLAQSKDAAARADLIARVDRLEQTIDAALSPCLEHLGSLAAAIDGVGSLVFEAKSLAGFLVSCGNDIPTAVAAIRASLSYQVEQVRAGNPIPDRATPEPPASEQPAPPPVERRVVFILFPIKYFESAGFTRAHDAPCDVSLPLALADKAIACGAAVELEHPKARALMGDRVYAMPGSFGKCVFLLCPLLASCSISRSLRNPTRELGERRHRMHGPYRASVLPPRGTVSRSQAITDCSAMIGPFKSFATTL